KTTASSASPNAPLYSCKNFSLRLLYVCSSNTLNNFLCGNCCFTAATVAAVKQQFPHKKLLSVLELHTYSSLSEKFLQEYKGALSEADEAVVFYSRHALELKQLPDLSKEKLKEGFDQPNLHVFNERQELEDWLNQQELENAVVLFMSSGNYEGLDVEGWAKKRILSAE
ncbi:MAG: hypothetical protein ICV53_23885, partial [Flavisolibacter sp.]|nr:hypothetical protein [Flavisolibacter sp.]